MNKSRVLIILLLLCISVAEALSQSVTHTTEGVSGDIDKKRRSPSVSVTTVIEETGVKLLTDAYVPNEEFKRYPIQFDFFVNRRLFASQIRSPELPGPVGVDIAHDVAVPPFNFAVVAKVLHPNREYKTVFVGAAVPTSLAATVNCDITITEGQDDEATESTFSAEDVPITQNGSTAISFDFEGKDSEDNTALVVGTLTLNSTDNTAAGTLSITRNDTNQVVNVTGDVTFEGTDLTGLSVFDSDLLVDLNCS